MESIIDRYVRLFHPKEVKNHYEVKSHYNDTPAFNSKPYINEYGDLVIPFDSEPKYHWWNRGQDVYKTLLELETPLEVIKRYKISKN